MSNDTELFELCKTVYEQTGWRATGKYWIADTYPEKPYDLYVSDKVINEGGFSTICPLYTSDYLLEKLEVVGYVDGPSKGVELMMDHHNGWGWLAHIPEYYYKYGGDKWVGFSDTPLKALLKLTIALHKAGELK